MLFGSVSVDHEAKQKVGVRATGPKGHLTAHGNAGCLGMHVHTNVVCAGSDAIKLRWSVKPGNSQAETKVEGKMMKVLQNNGCSSGNERMQRCLPVPAPNQHRGLKARQGWDQHAHAEPHGQVQTHSPEVSLAGIPRA